MEWIEGIQHTLKMEALDVNATVLALNEFEYRFDADQLQPVNNCSHMMSSKLPDILICHTTLCKDFIHSFHLWSCDVLMSKSSSSWTMLVTDMNIKEISMTSMKMM